MSNKHVDAAIALIQERGYFEQGEIERIIAAADALEGNGGPTTKWHHRLIHLADGYRRQRAPSMPPTPTPFDAAITEAEAELAPLEAAWRNAIDEHHRLTVAARQAVVGPQSSPAKRALAEQRALAAGDAVRLADQAWLRVKARWTALELARSSWRADAATQYAHCGCKRCKGEPTTERPKNCIGYRD